MQTRSASRYLHLARKSIAMAEQASHPNNRETLVRFTAIWIGLAADELTDHPDDMPHKRNLARVANKFKT